MQVVICGLLEFVKSSSTEYVISRSIQLEHKTPEHVSVIRCYISRLFPKLNKNISEIIFSSTFNPNIIWFTLTLAIKTRNMITPSESMKEG